MQDFKLKVSPKRSFVFTLFTFFPLLIIGLFSLIFLVVSILGILHNPPSLAIIIVFCAGLFAMIGFLSFTKVFIWVNFGKEIIKIDKEYIFIKRRFAFGVKDQKYPLSAIRNLRLVDKPEYEVLESMAMPWHTRAIYAPKFGGSVAFDVGSESVYVGNLLPKDEAEDLRVEIEKRASLSHELIDVENTSFDAIKLSETDSGLEIKYAPKRDVWVIIAIISWWVVWTFTIAFGFLKEFENNSPFTMYSNEFILKWSLLPFVSLFVLSWIIHLVFRHERLVITKDHLIIRKPFYFYLKRKIDLSSIQDIQLMEELKLKPYWSMGKNVKHKTYVARFGNRLKLITDKKTYRFGKERAYPEGLFIKTLIERSRRSQNR